MKLVYVYGVISIYKRANDLLPNTLGSLAEAGFTLPYLFLDGVPTGLPIDQSNVTIRHTPANAFSNWFLAALELYLRNPQADAYIIFEDDFLICKNTRLYVEKTCDLKAKAYYNLYTSENNHRSILTREDGKRVGWHLSDQMGRGALSLMFPRQTFLDLLRHPHMYEKPLDRKKGWKNVDGAICHSLKELGYVEYVHNPSLVFHTGLESSIGNRPFKPADSFPGKDFDALTFQCSPQN